MDDLVKRLRYHSQDHGDGMLLHAALFGQAADDMEAAQAEIATLRERADALALQADEWEGKYAIVSQQNATLRAELAGAREALAKIADMTDIEADFDGFEARDIARAMLAASPIHGEGG